MADVEHEVKETTQVVTPTGQQVATTKKVVTAQPAVKMEHPQVVYDTKRHIFRVYQVIWYILGVIEVLLGFRTILKIFGADPLSGFAGFVYAVSEPFAAPFYGIVPAYVAGRAVFEWSTYIAMIVYFVIAYGIVKLFQFIKPVTPEEVEQTVDST